ncbi:xylulokinase [Cocleimonas sp. KMM 6892]|uniref:xylulokinase n=1 Tax=unclassified Cocleimonas TaxID=2639732 RepID=UPI002DB67B1A|nr:MULTISPECIES: xylulokinase [unclassified Cocleimonas]MEB8432704.1 xylulokinase [Cocleimonas sp. KMM 6892]MEC4715563.1 xylulokinase [Cocleimonas sp. KMM 6895]MEC4744819.1 xylulokinase [Cocleimonas sp. KMM 6896]
MYLGLDLGTSGLKAVLCNEDQQIIAQNNVSLSVSRPHPKWSEQNPEDWWNAVVSSLTQLKASNPDEMMQVKAIGLAGQMHGAVLLDDEGNILRPAILWNDVRSATECEELEKSEPNFKALSGNPAFPGFTSPKLMWVAKHEPEVFAKVAKVLLPKDYIRFRLSGEYISEMSDSAGTLWLDVKNRKWSERLLAATNLNLSHMPKLVEGSAEGGKVTDELSQKFGLQQNVIIAGGAGDNAGGAVGIGAVSPGQAFLSLGTSGVIFVCNESYLPKPEAAIHTFCHALPNTWHQMSVMLNASSCLDWLAELTNTKDVSTLLNEVEQIADEPSDIIFLPYLTGERTPHNDADAKGVFFGMTATTKRANLGLAVLEGVAYAFADGLDPLLDSGATINQISVIGGGARSELWGQILSDVLGQELTYHEDAESGPAFGAARLARLAFTGEDVSKICTTPPVKNTIKPNPTKQQYYKPRLERFRRLYTSLKPEFSSL